MKKLSFFIVMLFATFVLTGCTSLSPDPKLHDNLPQNDKPLIQENVIVTAKMNDRIAKQDTAVGIDDLVRQTIQMALNKANIFNSQSQQYYKIHAQIVQASQPSFSLGRFPGKMEIEYTVTNPNGKTVFNKTIYNEGQSDSNAFLGDTRHKRSRIVTAAGNVNQFIEAFNKSMQQNSSKKETKKAKKRK